MSGAAAGAISTGTWQGALLGAASAVTFYGIGNVTTPWLTTPAADAAPDGAFTVTNYVGVGASAVVHGLAGGMISVAEGGNFQSGFLSAGVSDLPGPFYANNAAVAGMEETVVGGASSVLGGGKFANGAETAGFSFVFNNLSDLHNTRQGFTAGLMGGTVAATACDVGTLGACALGDPGIISTTTAFGTIQGFIHDAAETFWEWFNSKPPANAWDPNGPKAPGYPGAPGTGHPDYVDPKGGPNWVPNPNGPGYGWEDRSGNVWVPTGQGGAARGGPHWDVQDPSNPANYENKYPTTR